LGVPMIMWALAEAAKPMTAAADDFVNNMLSRESYRTGRVVSMIRDRSALSRCELWWWKSLNGGLRYSRCCGNGRCWMEEEESVMILIRAIDDR
jgi:hypothetical protein